MKPGRSILYALLTFLFLASTAITLLSAFNIHNYQRLRHETEVAKIHFSEIAEQRYRAELVIAGGDQIQDFEILGDEWQLDARVIKWKMPLTLMGFNSLYKLDRLQGRYQDINQQHTAAHSIFALSPGGSLDLWSIIQQYRKWLPWLDAFYGSASYLPMSDNASFQISMSQSGLIARPINQAASGAINEWD